MEELLNKLHAYSRQLELQDSISDWENQSAEMKARTSEMTENLRKKEQAQATLEKPTFFQKIFGKAETEKAKLGRQIREIATARMAVQWELEALEKKIIEGKQELQTLSGSGTDYDAAKADMVLTPVQESCLMMEEISAFAPAAMKAAGRALETLEMTALGQDRQNAESAANQLRSILSVLPEGVAPIGGFLLAPRDFLKDADGLCYAREQIQQIINQLKLLLGE